MRDQAIRLFEQESIPYSSIGLKADDPILVALDNVRTSNGGKVFSLERDYLRATNYVGVVQVEGKTIEVFPKIDFESTDQPRGFQITDHPSKVKFSAAQNFFYLINHLNSLSLSPQGVAPLYQTKTTWLENLTRLFIQLLLTELGRGFNHDYVRKEDYLPYLRGRWNIARQFATKPMLTEGLDVSFDDYLPDTMLNRVFKLTVHRLKTITKDPANLRGLLDLDNWLQEVTLPQDITSEDLDGFEFSRLNERFQPAFKLAKMFLEGFSVQLLAGRQRVYSLMFDMNKLFEDLITKILTNQSRNALPVNLKGCVVDIQGGPSKKHLVQRVSLNNELIFQIKPDIILKGDSATKLIIDAKNKILDEKRVDLGVDESDIYQMLAYASGFNCSNFLLLYPRNRHTGSGQPFKLKVLSKNINIYIATINLHKPLEKLSGLEIEIKEILTGISLDGE